MEWPCNSAVVFAVEDMEIWNASSDGFSFVISYESSAGRLSRTQYLQAADIRLRGVVAADPSEQVRREDYRLAL